MKELFMEEMYENGMASQHMLPEPFTTSPDSNVLCPNCMVDTLVPHGEEELACHTCGQEFDLVSKNTVKFK